MQYIKNMSAYLIALLGAAGSALQNFMAVVLFLGRTTSLASFFINLSAGVASVCSGLVNLCINIDLLNSFADRLTGEKATYPGKGWQRFSFYAGSLIFITTGILFALTAIAFGPAGPLAMLGIIAGVFVGLIMMIQELETWLKAFNEEHEYVSFWEGLTNWWHHLTLGKAMGTFIALGNTLALSLLLTSGLGLFLMGFGVPIVTALIVGFSIAFTVGAFTEFYFYNKFLSDFCHDFTTKCKALLDSDYAFVGVVSIIINAGVNTALCYAGVFMLSGFAASASLAFPPLGLAIIAAGFGGLASLLLGADFWIDNSKYIANWFSGKKTYGYKSQESTCLMHKQLNVAPNTDLASVNNPMQSQSGNQTLNLASSISFSSLFCWNDTAASMLKRQSPTSSTHTEENVRIIKTLII